MSEGGIYVVLPKIIEYLNNATKDRFTPGDLTEITGLGKQTIINNLSRLVGAGYLERHEFRIPNKTGRRVEYSVSPYAVDLIKDLIE